MRIGELASKVGVTTDTLRFYENKGLIQSMRQENGYRDYSDEMIFILNYIQTAQRLGFSLTEIGEEIPQLLQGGISADKISELLRKKIALTDRKIEELKTLKKELESLLEASCPLVPPADHKP